MTPLWTADPRAIQLLADCAANPPVKVSRTFEGLVHRETHLLYTNHDPRIRELKAIRRRVIGDDVPAHFDQPSIEEAVDAVVSRPATLDGEAITRREAAAHVALARRAA